MNLLNINLLNWISKYKLTEDGELEMQFGMTVICIWLMIVFLGYSAFFYYIGFYDLQYISVASFAGLAGMLFYCRKRRPNYVLPYMYFLVLGVAVHILVTHYIGDCGTVFFVLAILMAPHMFIIIKPWQTVVLDIFLLAVICLVYWYSANHVPGHYDKVGITTRIITVNVALITCLIELYFNMSTQTFIAAARQSLVEKFSATAVLDALTGLGNRQMLEQHRAELEQAFLDNSQLCVAMLDIDFFKKVNDTHGHIVGDQVLEFAAQTMRNFFRKNDLLIRWGGEEFLVILRDTSFDDAAALMEKFRVRMQNTPLNIGGKEIPIRLTIGLTELNPSITLDDSIKQADDLMYLGKLQGRNRMIGNRVIAEAVN